MNQIAGLFVAGHATVAHLIGNAVYNRLSTPSGWAQLAPQEIPAVIEEVLRMEPPIAAFVRTAMKDTTVHDVPIAAGDKVLVSFGCANRDESQFGRPDEFQLRRPNAFRHLGLGWGTHVCSGSALARLEGRIALQALRDRWPRLRLAPGFRPQWLASLVFRGLARLDVTWS